MNGCEDWICLGLERVSLIPSVSLSVCLSGKCTVAKWLTGSGYRLEGGVFGRRMSVLDGDGDRRRGRAVLGVNLGHPIVSNGDFVA